MNPIEKDPNNPAGEPDNKLTEGSYQAIQGGEEGAEDNASNKEASADESSESKKDTFKTITDLQDERGKDSGVDAARREGPYGVQE